MAATSLRPSLDRINALLRYHRETGTFLWRVRRGPSALDGSLAGATNAAGYRTIVIDGRTMYVHTLVWFMETGEWIKGIDHCDTDKANNRIGNLRLATKIQNGQNRSAPRQNTLGHKGVSWAKRERRWRANINANKKYISLGYFRSIDDAIEAYRIAALKYHGEYANTSGPRHLDQSGSP